MLNKGFGGSLSFSQTNFASSTMNSSKGWNQVWNDRLSKEIERGKSYNKKELPALNSLIKLPHERLQIMEVAQMSVEKKLLKSEQNDINFYSIPTYDRKRAKKRNNTNFRTQHQISDKALLGDAKLFQDTKLSAFEKTIRSELRKEDPKNNLLLGEIYKKLEDSMEEENMNIQLNNQNDRNAKQNDTKLVEGLDGWIKHQKQLQSQKEQQLKAQSQPKAQGGAGGAQSKANQQAAAALQERIQFNRKETIKRMSSTLPNLLSKEGLANAQAQQSPDSTTRFPHLVGMLKGNDGASPFGGAKVKKQATMAEALQDQQYDDNTADLGSARSGDRPPLSRGQSTNYSGIGAAVQDDAIDHQQHKSKFFDALQDALKTINEKEKEKANEINTVMYDKDRGLRKTIKNYIKKVPDIQDPNQKLKGEQVATQEFTSEGMRSAIEDLFKIDDEEGISSVIDRARFYEKQAGLIESSLISKIRDTISLINNKVNTARILRLENYQLLRKINQLRTLIKQLNEDLTDQQNKASKGTTKMPNDSQFFGDSQVAKRKLQQSDVMSTGSNSNPISPMPNQSGVGGERSSRQNLIGNLMNNVQKLNELESEIATLKSTLVSYEARIKENDKQIIAVEENINAKKKELKALQKGKKIFLLELLKNGKDARSEGLSWVIRSIWNGQEKVFDSYLPDFLDQKAKEYLLSRSQKEDELQNMVSLLNMQLELYKANMMINDHMKDIEGLQIDEDDDEGQYKLPEPSSLLQDPNSSQGSIITGKYQGSNLLPNLSKIDVKRIRHEQTQKRKYDKIENIEELIEGIDPQQQGIVQRTLNELNTSKQTSNDIIYNQTKKKIKEVVRHARQQQLEIQLQKEREKIDAEQNGTLLNANQSIISAGETKTSLHQHQQQQQQQKIVLYENQNVINKYDSREEFVKQYEQLCNKIEEKNKQIKGMEEEELMRIIREFDYKNYRKRMGASCQVVLCSLFGCYKADKELIRHGMTRK